MIRLRVGGVPEHFNLPWLLALEARRFAALGVELAWNDYPGGSGAMVKALRDRELDAALLLTEGAIAGIADGAPFKVASLYTESPLLWGIHVPAGSRLQSIGDVRGARYAISRFGSGSHLMAVVHAQARGWPVADLELVTVGNLDGAVAAFAAGKADVFFWERFMTQPLVDAGRFRRVAEFAAPWPAFVVCMADAADSPQRDALARVLALVLGEAAALRARPDAASVIATRYGLAPSAVTQWLASTRWSARVGVASAHLEPACTTLSSLGVLSRPIAAAECVAG